MIKQGINIYKGISEIATELCNFLAAESDRKNYSVALPGGNTPKAIFELMAQNCKYQVHWDNLQFFWGDERCVGPDHPESNYKMANESLLHPLEIDTSVIHRIKGENDPVFESERYTLELLKHVQNRNGLTSFNLVILGMGDDGHTASIFPGQHNIIESTKLCDHSVHPTSGQNRITLTLETINNSENVFFLVTGKKKASLIAEIIKDKSSRDKYPAAMVRPNDGNLCWLLDTEAAEELKDKVE